MVPLPRDAILQPRNDGGSDDVKIGIFGTGSVGQTFGHKLSSLGHAVMIGTRDVADTMAREQPDNFGNPPFRVWREQHPNIAVGSFVEAARHGELAFNVLSGRAAVEVAKQVGEELVGKTLIDVTNALDFSKGMPPSLLVSNTDSLAEQIQRELPRTHVIKALNTVTASVMVDPGQVGGGDHTAFVSGNDAAAKAEVVLMLKDWFGWKDVIDLGDITTARGPEMLLPLWVRLMQALGTASFGFKIVR
jgi:8-hydroxy-5-deazaflavin:NADPH oxidoreductase